MSLQFLKQLNGNNKGHFDALLNTMDESINPKIAWYPSCGDDFRNLIFLNEKYCAERMKKGNKWEQPDIFIYTDYYTPFFDRLFPDESTENFVNPLSAMDALFSEYADIGGWELYSDKRTSVRVKRFEYLPSIDARVDPQLVQFTDITSESKKVAYMLLEVWSKTYGTFDVNLIYANVENEYFADQLIKSGAEVSHITHVRYGAGFGLAKATGSYLKGILLKLKTQYFISDPYLEMNDGDKAATRLYPSLRSHRNIDAGLELIHKVPSESWSCHGDVSFFSVNYN
jgi:hypothetical protein